MEDRLDMTALDIKTLKEIREERGISIGELALKAGVSPSTIARTENGLLIRNSSKVKIAKALNIPPTRIDFFVVGHNQSDV